MIMRVLGLAWDVAGWSYNSWEPAVPCREINSGLLQSDPLLASIISKLSIDSANVAMTQAPTAKETAEKQLGVDIQAYLIPFQDLLPQCKIGSGAFAQVREAGAAAGQARSKWMAGSGHCTGQEMAWHVDRPFCYNWRCRCSLSHTAPSAFTAT